MKEFSTAIEATDSKQAEEEVYVPFKLDGREYHAYKPNDTQLVFLMASMGRGQTNDKRFSSIVALMFESLRGDDKDAFESRMMTGDRSQTIPLEVVESIFEYLIEQWFRPTDGDDSAAVRAGVDVDSVATA